jgi:hypothetical protein
MNGDFETLAAGCLWRSTDGRGPGGAGVADEACAAAVVQ